MPARLALGFGAVLLVCACANNDLVERPKNAPPPPTPIKVAERITLTPAQRRGVEDAVRRGLKDPGSAQFGNMNAAKTATGLITICGWVNAKNSFGGYVGSKPFLAALVPETNKGVMIGMGGSNIDDSAIQSTCLKEGVPLGFP